MRQYATDYIEGEFTVEEFSWSIPRDANLLYSYDSYEVALEEAHSLNEIVFHYREKMLGGRLD